MAVGIAQCDFHALAFRYIPRQLAKARELAAAVRDGDDLRQRPELRAIFSLAPAFLLESSLLGCPLQIVLGMTFTPVLVGVKHT